MMYIKNNKKGFTLIELLVVISIISLLSSIVLASISSVREKARITAGKAFDGNLYRTLTPIGVWDFEEGLGNTIVDISGNQNTGTIITPQPTNFSTDTPGFGSKFSFLLGGCGWSSHKYIKKYWCK